MKNFVKAIINEVVWAIVGLGALIVGLFYDYHFLAAISGPGHLSMNTLEWFVVIWLTIVPTLIGIGWVFDMIDRIVRRIASKKVEVAA